MAVPPAGGDAPFGMFPAVVLPGDGEELQRDFQEVAIRLRNDGNEVLAGPMQRIANLPPLGPDSTLEEQRQHAHASLENLLAILQTIQDEGLPAGPDLIQALADQAEGLGAMAARLENHEE